VVVRVETSSATEVLGDPVRALIVGEGKIGQDCAEPLQNVLVFEGLRRPSPR